ncbi:MAG: hypothetical protein WA151_23170, partial [Desulfatirhabdiaceae bacterium]
LKRFEISSNVMNLSMAFKINIWGALSVGDGQKRHIPSLLPSQNHYLKSYIWERTLKEIAIYDRVKYIPMDRIFRRFTSRYESLRNLL